MIARIRHAPPHAPPRRATPGTERAHRWIRSTLLEERATQTAQANLARRAWLAVAWIGIVAAFYFGRVLVDLLAMN
jgi:hypothetical protein